VDGEEDCGFYLASWYGIGRDDAIPLPFFSSFETAGKSLHTWFSTDTGEPVFLPFRMSCFVLSNLVVTAGMLTPGLGVWSIPIYSHSYPFHSYRHRDTDQTAMNYRHGAHWAGR
jgi:hypothetical protein